MAEKDQKKGEIRAKKGDGREIEEEMIENLGDMKITG